MRDPEIAAAWKIVNAAKAIESDASSTDREKTLATALIALSQIVQSHRDDYTKDRDIKRP